MARQGRSRSQSELVDDDLIEAKHESSDSEDLADNKGSTEISSVKDEHSPSDTIAPSTDASTIKVEENFTMPTPKLKTESDRSPVKSEHGAANGQPSPRTALPSSAKQSKASKKNVPRVAPLLDHLPDATAEANSNYSVIDACIYQNKFLGYTEHAMECDCSEEWDPVTKTNSACGEDSDCINRATKMECVGDCTCGPACQNQRFGRRMYANVSVIKTDKKGYGLRTNTLLKPGDFIFEYIGEVIPEGTFRKRMHVYDEEGIKHFYFMSLSKGEFVDATKKGNLGRFCNHSCNPNCYVDKWVVGDKLRMGIFAERRIQAGEELVFNYNVDRYGANPQPCYCGEDNCTGFIGGKTQTERATKLSSATLEALGIEDDWDAWDTAVAKRPKKKKTAEEEDEDYVERAEARGLDADGVTKVMAALMQCKEKWIAVKLLQRIQRCNDEDVLHRIIKLHGYKILNSQLAAWREDENVILQILDILDKFPRLTRNKIVDAKIDKSLEPLKDSSDERVAVKSQELLEQWSRLELAYRIPRKIRTANEASNTTTPVKFERRESQQQRKRSRSRSRSKSPPKGPASVAVPTGPKGVGVRPTTFNRPTTSFPRGPPPLPTGWFSATDAGGRLYFYSSTGETTWKRPSKAAVQPPPPPKQPSQQDMLKSIIDDIVTAKEKDAKVATPDTPEVDKKEKKEEKWRSYDEDKKKKLYENTLFPHIAHVMNKYKHKIPKDDLKRFAKDLSKKLVSSDFKAGRVEDPTKISEKQQKKVKNYCKEYFDKAAAKHKKHEEERAARKAKRNGHSHAEANTATPATETPLQSPGLTEISPKKEELSDDEDIKMSDIDEDHENPSPDEAELNGALKRKRSVDDTDSFIKDEEDITKSPIKKPNLMDESAIPTPPPPPPPAPPAESPPEAGSPNEQQQDDHHQEDGDVMDTDIHADTNFRGKSMADVLAQAQQEEDEVDWGMDELDEDRKDMSRFEQGIGENGVMLDNPIVDGQPVVEQIKQELDG